GFVLSIASAVMGITEKAIFSIDNYSNLPSSGVMVNLCGVLFVSVWRFSRVFGNKRQAV
ncbi:hypothetical protein DOY81_013727, partial [Sarcophaga bullata]